MDIKDLKKAEAELLRKIKSNLPKLKQLLDKCSSEFASVEMIYRFYHHSFKVYALQEFTQEIVEALSGIQPKGTSRSSFFNEILERGSGLEWENSHNKEWVKHAGAIVDAFFHARFFLEMAVEIGEQMDEPPVETLPYNWASLLCLFNIR